MSIKRTTAFVASDGSVHATVEEAQGAEMIRVLRPLVERAGLDGNDLAMVNRLALELLSQRDLLIDILTTGPRSRPAARKKAGTTAPRRAVGRRATRAEAAAGFAAMHAAADEAVPA